MLCISAFTVCASASELSDLSTRQSPFEDVKETDWFYDDVKFVYESDLMTGTGKTEFSPDGVTTRGMIVTILWRVDGEPVSTGKDFKDVSSDSWYSKAVAWASSNQIVNGYNETNFGPNDVATREQLAVIMYRFASYKKYDLSKKSKLDNYEDREDISYYAVESIEWANENGIISGTSETSISPKDNVLRSQVAAILRRFCEKFEIMDGVTTSESENAKDDNAFPQTGSSIDPTDNSSGDNSEMTYEPDEEIVDNAEVKSASVKLKTTYGEPGQIIPVSVDLRENPGILGAILTLEYDEDAMTLIDAKNGKAVSEVLTLTHSKELSSGMNFVWDGLELDSRDIKEGELLVLYFELSPEAIPGKRYPLKLTHKPGSVIDADLNRVNLMISQGFIEIEETNRKDDWFED